MTEQNFPGLELWPESMQAKQLFILLHGLGAQASDLVPLAEALMDEFPQAGFFLPDATFPFDGGGNGRQWYSNIGINDALRAERVVAAIPAMHALICQTQKRFKVMQSDTALVGFSQGAHMALQLCAQHDGLVGRVLSFAGRLVVTPEKAPELTTIHLLHGADDSVIPAAYAQAAYNSLKQIVADVTLDVLPDVGHEVHPLMVDCAIHRLKTTIPMRSWKQAMKDA